MQLLEQVGLKYQPSKLRRLLFCDLVFISDGAVAMVVVVVVVVVTVVDDSPVVAVSVLAFLGEGSQPFFSRKRTFSGMPCYNSIIPWQWNIFCYFCFSTAKFEIACSAYTISSF